MIKKYLIYLHLNAYFVCFWLIMNPFSLMGQLPPDFNDELFTAGWNQPTHLAFDENGRMYVCEKAGIVTVLDQVGERLGILIDLREEVANWGDHGLLGFALHPNFSSNGFFYLYYAVERNYLLNFETPTYDPENRLPEQATIGRITRYTADANNDFFQIVPGSRKVLLGESKQTGIPLVHKSHGIGTLAFGTDGSLLVSAGDGASFNGADTGGDNISRAYNVQAVQDSIITKAEDVGAFRAQMIQSLNGKILRIDPETGDGLPGNPFFDEAVPRSAASRVWALGFRNPFRFAVKPGTGSHDLAAGDPGVLYVGDVGWVFWEEINVVTQPAMNFGWPQYDGLVWGDLYNQSLTFNTTVPNTFQNETDCSHPFIAFQDLILPATLDPDFTLPHPCKPTDSISRALTPIFYHSPPELVWNNKLWLEGIFTNVSVFDEEGLAAEVSIEDPNSPIEGEAFNGICSVGGLFYTGTTYPDEYFLSYMNADLSGWIKRFDYSANDEIIQVHDFHNDCRQLVSMAVNPVDGLIYYIPIVEGEIRQISYKGNPAPTAIIKVDQFYGISPLEVQFDGSESFDPEDQSLTYLWDFGTGETSTEVNPTYIFESALGEPSSFEVRLTVTDSLGESHTEQMIISPNNTPPQIEISDIQDGDLYPINGNTFLPLTAEVRDLEQDRESLQYAWSVFLHHNTHFHAEPVDSAQETNVLIEALGCGDETYYYRINLTVTDNQGLSSSQEVQIYPYCGPLLSDLQTFFVQEASEGVALSWEMASLPSGSSFVIERAPDERSFTSIGTLSPSLHQLTYQFTDKQPIQGINYYRIRTQTADRTYDYSEIREIVYPTILLYPNPVADRAFIQFDRIAGEAIFELYDPSGRMVHSAQWVEDAEEAVVKGVDLSPIAPGVYMYIIRNGSTEVHGKMVK